MEELTKKCTKCGEVKSLSEFRKDKLKSSGYRSNCKCCDKSYISDNKDKRKAYYEANKDKIKACNKAYHEANKYKINYKKMVYRDANKDKIKAYNRANVKQLRDGYIAQQFRIPRADCPPELIELKRAQLKLIRAIKEQ